MEDITATIPTDTDLEEGVSAMEDDSVIGGEEVGFENRTTYRKKGNWSFEFDLFCSSNTNKKGYF